MKLELKPIRILIKISLILHVIGLLIVIIMNLFQVQLMPLFGLYRTQEDFVSLPLINILMIVLNFLLHSVLSIAFLNKKGRPKYRIKRMRFYSILSFIYVIAITKVLITIYNISYMSFIRENHDEMSSIATLSNMMNIGFAFRTTAFTILMIAASMMLYYCYIKKLETRFVEVDSFER